MTKYPTTYNEMGAWISLNIFCRHFPVDEAKKEEIYDWLCRDLIETTTGEAESGIVTVRLKDGTETKLTAKTDLDATVYERMTVTHAGLVITYTAAYLAARRPSSSSGGFGSNNNNNNNNNNNG